MPNQLRTLITQNTEFIGQPVPDDFTDRAGWMKYQEDQRKFMRKCSFIRKSLTEVGLSLKELLLIIESAEGGKENGGTEKAQELVEKSKNSSTYKNYLVAYFKEKKPDLYQQAKDQGAKNQKDYVAFAEKHLNKALLEKILVQSVLADIDTLKHSERLRYFSAIGDGLTQSHLEEMTSRMTAYKDPLDIDYHQYEVQYMKDRCQELRQQADEAVKDDDKRKAHYLELLDFADKTLKKIEPHEIHTMMNAIEADVQHTGAAFDNKSVSITAVDFKEGMYDKLFQKHKTDFLAEVNYVTSEKEEVIRDMNEDCIKMSPRMKEGVKKLIQKMREMQILAPGEEAPGEDGSKIYAFRKFLKKRTAFEEALKSGDVDKIIETGDVFKKDWEDFEELYRIAKKYLNIDPTLFPGNLDSVRNGAIPAHFSFDLATTAAVNGAFLIYNVLNKTGIELDQYLEDPVKYSYQKLHEGMVTYGIDNVTKDQPFEVTLDCLYDFNSARDNAYSSHTVDFSVGRGNGFLCMCDPDENTRTENAIRSQLYFTYNNEVVVNAQSNFGVMRNGTTEARQNVLMNFITVKPGDVTVSQMIHRKYVKPDLTLGEPFSLDQYVATHADYEGMISRADALLKFLDKQPVTMTEEALLAIQQAFAKTLQVHVKDRGKVAGYEKLMDAFLKLEERLPQNAAPETRTRMAGQRDALEMALPEGPATSKWTAIFFEQLAAGGNGLSENNANALHAVTEALQELRNAITPFNIPNELGDMAVLKAEDLTGLQAAYQKVANAIDAFAPEANNPASQNIGQLFAGLKGVLGQDMAALAAAKQGELGTLGDLLKKGRSLKVTVDGPLQTVGDMASTRMRIDVPGPDNTQIKGFFTPNNDVYTADKGKNMARKAIEEALQRHGHPELKPYVNTVIFKEVAYAFTGEKGLVLGNGDQLFQLSRKFDRTSDHAKLFETLIGRYEQDLGANGVKALSTEAGARILMDVLRDLSPLTLVGDYARNGLVGNIDKRNSAMSTMADLLGMNTVIAGSRPMTITHDGQEITGTFMSFAEGVDMMDFKPGNPLNNVGPADMMTTESLKSLADLQILDYICGNVDRHSANMFYKFSDGRPPKFLGVQGIDNDYSFCIGEGANSIPLRNVNIITETTAQKIMALTPALLETVLRAYGLPQQEIDAAWNRTHKLQEEINRSADYFKDKPADYVEEKRVRVVKEADLVNFGPTSKLYNSGIFSRMLNAPSDYVGREIAQNDKKLEDRYKTLRTTTDNLARALNGVEDANRGFFIGSSAYRTAMNGVRDTFSSRNGYLEGADPQKLTEYRQKLAETKHQIEVYLVEKTKIPEERRTALEKRRIEAMSRAYLALDKEDLLVADAVPLAEKALDAAAKTGPLQDKLKSLKAKKNLVSLKIYAAGEYERLSKPENQYECEVMKKFREQVRETMYQAQTSYDGSEPTEEMKATAPYKMATSLTYSIMNLHIRSLKTPEQKQEVYQKLQDHPEFVEKIRSTIMETQLFKDRLEYAFSEAQGGYANGIKGAQAFGLEVPKLKEQVMKKMAEKLAAKAAAPEGKEPTKEAQKTVQEVKPPVPEVKQPGLGNASVPQ